MNEELLRKKILKIMNDKNYYTIKDNVVIATKLFVINQILRFYSRKIMVDAEDKDMKFVYKTIEQFLAGDIEIFWDSQSQNFQIISNKILKNEVSK
jgi:hypothetical protein